MIYADTQFVRRCEVFAYEPSNLTPASENRLSPCRETWKAMGIPGIRSCGLYPVAIFSPSASAVEWL